MQTLPPSSKQTDQRFYAKGEFSIGDLVTDDKTFTLGMITKWNAYKNQGDTIDGHRLQGWWSVVVVQHGTGSKISWRSTYCGRHAQDLRKIA